MVTSRETALPLSYIERSLEPVLKRAAAEFPALMLTGPRQSGKTTTLKRLFGGSFDYVSLDAPDVRAAAQEDPRGFLADRRAPLIVDEVQNAPHLLPYIKERIDARRGRAGQYVLTGSQNLLLLQQVSETLAGRTAVLRLLPLTLREIAGDPHRPLAVLPSGRVGGFDPPELGGGPAYGEVWRTLLRGGYPEIVASPGRDAQAWYAAYLQTYLERDVRTLRQVGDLLSFRAFMQSLAARSGQLLSLSDLARDLGIATNTAKAWLSALEASYQVLVLRPYFADKGKQLVKTPKVYFTDTGLLCHLVGLRDPSHAAAGPMAGAVFETAVVAEIVKSLLHQGESAPRVWFWRTRAGNEIDVVVQDETLLVPVEAKSAGTPTPRMAFPFRSFKEDFRDTAAPGWLVHPGDSELPLGEGVKALPVSRL